MDVGGRRGYMGSVGPSGGMVDAGDSKSPASNGMRVRVSPRVPLSRPVDFRGADAATVKFLQVAHDDGAAGEI